MIAVGQTLRSKICEFSKVDVVDRVKKIIEERYCKNFTIGFTPDNELNSTTRKYFDIMKKGNGSNDSNNNMLINNTILNIINHSEKERLANSSRLSTLPMTNNILLYHMYREDSMMEFMRQMNFNGFYDLLIETDKKDIRSILHRLVSIMDPLIGNFYNLLTPIIAKHFDLPSNAIIKYHKIIPDNKSLQVIGYEPFYTLRFADLNDNKRYVFMVFPYTKRIGALCIFNENDPRDHKLIKDTDILVYNSSIGAHIHNAANNFIPFTPSINNNVYNKDTQFWILLRDYKDTKDCIDRLIDLKNQLINDADGAVDLVYGIDSSDRINIMCIYGNLTNHLFCDVRDGNGNPIINLLYDSNGEKARMLQNPSHIDYLTHLLKKKDKDTTTTNSNTKEHIYEEICKYRENQCNLFINEKIEPIIIKMCQKAIQSNRSLIPPNITIAIHLLPREIHQSSLKIVIAIKVQDCSTIDKDRGFMRFSVYDYDDDKVDKDFAINKSAMEFSLVGTREFAGAITDVLENVTDDLIESFREHLRKVTGSDFNAGSILATRFAWRKAIERLHDIILADGIKSTMETLVDLFHKFNRDFDSDPVMVDLKKQYEVASVKEKEGSLVDRANNLVLRKVGYDIKKFVAELNYYLDTTCGVLDVKTSAIKR